MEKSMFFNARETQPGVYDRVYQAEEFAAYFAKFIGNGVFPNPSTGLQVVQNSTPDMTTVLSAGSAYINGYTYINDAPLVFTHKVADGTLNRKDAIFIRFDKSGRAINAYKMESSLSTDPVTPSVIRTSDYYDLCVGVVNIPAGSTKITQDMIEDTRMDTKVCGYVTGLIEQVDTTTLYNQIQSDLKYFKNVSQKEFDEWFADINAKLGTEPATNLQNQVNKLNDAIGGLELELSDKTNTVSLNAIENRVGNVEIKGFTTQTGSGDASPANIRKIENAGMYNAVVIVDLNKYPYSVTTSGFLNVVRVDVQNALQNMLFVEGSTVVFARSTWLPASKTISDNGDYPHFRTGSTAGSANGLVLYIPRSVLAGTTATDIKNYLAQNPLSIMYKSTDNTGDFYTGSEVEQGDEYRCEIIELQAPLHEGDTLETNVQSEYDAELIVDGAKVVSVSQTSSGNYRINLNVPDDFPVPEAGAVPNAKANYLFPTAANTLQSFDVKGVFCAYLSAIYIVLEDQTVTAKEAAQSYFNDNPLRIFYKSASGGAGRLVRRETHTRKTLVLDGTSVKFTKAGSYWNLANKTAPNVAAIPQCTCSALPGRVFQANTTYHFLFASETQIIPYFDTVDACNAFLAQQYAAGTPVTIEYDLAAPEVYVDEPVEVKNPRGTFKVSSEESTTLTVAISAPVGRINGKTGASVTLTKADIGLSNVDNTPDAQKNVKGLVVEQTDVITGLPTGLYYYKANTPGAPSTVDGLLLALVYQPFGVQLAFPTNSGIFFRWAVNNWSEWVRLDK